MVNLEYGALKIGNLLHYKQVTPPESGNNFLSSGGATCL